MVPVVLSKTDDASRWIGQGRIQYNLNKGNRFPLCTDCLDFLGHFRAEVPDQLRHGRVWTEPVQGNHGISVFRDHA